MRVDKRELYESFLTTVMLAVLISYGGTYAISFIACGGTTKIIFKSSEWRAFASLLTRRYISLKTKKIIVNIGKRNLCGFLGFHVMS